MQGALKAVESILRRDLNYKDKRRRERWKSNSSFPHSDFALLAAFFSIFLQINHI